MSEYVIADREGNRFTVNGAAILPPREDETFTVDLMDDLSPALPCPYPRRRVLTARQEGQLTLHGRFFRLDECCGGHEST
jgi:hypothetical protein